MKKVVVIGLDGMAWHVLDKLFEWGVMPNLQILAQKSLKGTLRSTIPPESPPAWTSIATGVNPGKHGIFGFTKPTKDYDNTEIMSSRNVRYLRIHEMVAVQNLKSVCINQLLTYPIKRFPGSFVITDWLFPEIRYSPEIEQYARNYRGPTLGKTSHLLKRDWDAEYIDLSSRVETVNTLLQKVDWDLFWVVYSEPDRLFHRYFDLVMRKDEKLMRLLTKIDETFGLVKAVADLLIVVSDHGFSKFSYGVYVNTLLEKRGLVKRVKQQALTDLARHRQVDEQKVKFRLPEKLYKYISSMPSTVELALIKIYKQLLKANIKARLTTYADPKLSRAFSHGFGIYVKEKELIDYVVLILRKAHFIGGVWKKEELYDGEQLKTMPDVIMVPNFGGGFALRGDAIAPKAVIRRDFPSHHPDGIIMIYREDLQSCRVEGISVYDVVPTILDSLSLEIPEDTDGKVIHL